MLLDRLEGVQYVRLAPGAAEAVAPYVRTAPAEIGELVVDVPLWPVDVWPEPSRARDGRLLAGDPVLLDVSSAGLLVAGRMGQHILIAWDAIRQLDVLTAASTIR